MKWMTNASTVRKPTRATMTRRGSNINQMRCIRRKPREKECVPFHRDGTCRHATWFRLTCWSANRRRSCGLRVVLRFLVLRPTSDAVRPNVNDEGEAHEERAKRAHDQIRVVPHPNSVHVALQLK
eukprot:TRINITY_DN98035_c0_g1_i1.p1 TRINITY_DN98035_c0_g1~~TRINITY_DN98035_c0_g1_i1.p1  ORF type:complete len:125 (-),score=4.69 TRINITY_DN98035_c0_g1_i1:226-600(-)